MLPSLRQVDTPLEESEYILDSNGAIYHLRVKNEHIADTVILVGDQHRVKKISDHFSDVECRIENREFVTHTGTYNGKRITAMSSGIGADNIDIVINELDAAINIDPETRRPKADRRQLNIVRLGTSGSLQKDVAVDTYALADYGLGFDGVANFYSPRFEQDEKDLKTDFLKQVNWLEQYNRPYFVRANEELVTKLDGEKVNRGITVTANGFYGPQGRELLLQPANSDLNDELSKFRHKEIRIVNYEMETAALYALSSMLGHNACTICAVIANRMARKYSPDYQKTIGELIVYTLDRLTK